MEEFYKFVQNNNLTINFILGLIMTLSTLVYSILTWRLLNETKKMRESQYDPLITLYLESIEESINLINFEIINVGTGTAYDISFNIIKDINIANTKKLSNYNFVKKGIKYLPPNKKIKTYILNVTGMKENENGFIMEPIEIEITYKNCFKKTTIEKFILDLNESYAIRTVGKPPLYQIAKNIDELKKEFKNQTNVLTAINKTLNKISTTDTITEKNT